MDYQGVDGKKINHPLTIPRTPSRRTVNPAEFIHKRVEWMGEQMDLNEIHCDGRETT